MSGRTVDAVRDRFGRLARGDDGAAEDGLAGGEDAAKDADDITVLVSRRLPAPRGLLLVLLAVCTPPPERASGHCFARLTPPLVR